MGVFSRIQFADKDTNPIDYIVSAGVNAKGLIPGRDNDSMGLGFSYNKLQSARFLNALGIDDKSTAAEIFYNIELTPALDLNLNLQVTDSALPNIDTTTILGASLTARF